MGTRTCSGCASLAAGALRDAPLRQGLRAKARGLVVRAPGRACNVQVRPLHLRGRDALPRRAGWYEGRTGVGEQQLITRAWPAGQGRAFSVSTNSRRNMAAVMAPPKRLWMPVFFRSAIALSRFFSCASSRGRRHHFSPAHEGRDGRLSAQGWSMLSCGRRIAGPGARRAAGRGVVPGAHRRTGRRPRWRRPSRRWA